MKKILHSILSTSLLLATLPLASLGADFADVPSSYWASSFIQTAVEADLVAGMGNNLFEPESQMSYEQFAVMVVKGAYSQELEFKDQEERWSDPYIRILLEKKLLESANVSVVDTTADNWQGQPIPREDVATVVANLLRSQGKGEGTFSASFSDLNHASLVSNQTSDIILVQGLGVMTGVSDTSFGVGQVFTRAQASVVLHGLLEQGVLVKGESTSTEVFPELAEPESEPEPEPEASTLYNMPADTNGDGVISVEELNVVFEDFRAQYPQGTPWTNSTVYKTTLLRISDEGTISKTGLSATGCAAWAYQLEDAIFGDAPQYEITKDQLQAGDYWHTGTHWGVVMEVRGSTYITTEGNVNNSIFWDYSRGDSYLNDSVRYYSRHPQGNGG